jgi:hypothetical protein
MENLRVSSLNAEPQLSNPGRQDNKLPRQVAMLILGVRVAERRVYLIECFESLLMISPSEPLCLGRLKLTRRGFDVLGRRGEPVPNDTQRGD